MENLLDVYANSLEELFSMNEMSRQVHNGYVYKIMKGNKYDITIFNEIGTQYYRISITFQNSKKLFYVDLLMRYDDSSNKQMPDGNIPVQMQFNFIKEKRQKIINESWCEEVMKKLKYDENEFIKKLNSLSK